MNQTSHTGNLVIAIGASAGGLAEIIEICESLPQQFNGTVIVALHRAPMSERNELASLLANKLAIDVSSVCEGDHLCCATVFVGRATESTEVVGEEFQTTVDTTLTGRMSRIDDLFVSVAAEHGSNAVGVILSGTLDDGVAGLKAIRESKGRCLVQTPTDAALSEMPTNAIECLEPDFVGTSQQIARRINQMATDYDCIDCCE